MTEQKVQSAFTLTGTLAGLYLGYKNNSGLLGIVLTGLLGMGAGYIVGAMTKSNIVTLFSKDDLTK